MDSEKKHYRLYVQRTTIEHTAGIHNERFNRITQEYIFVYTMREMNGWAEITDENANVLSQQDREWLFGCNMVLIAEEMKDKNNKFGVDMNTVIEELEKALQKERNLLEDARSELE